MEPITCPHCQHSEHQSKVGQNPSGSQRYLCGFCRRKYTPFPTHHGYEETVRHQVIHWYIDGMNFRRIARHVGIDHQTVANWVKAYADTLPDAPPLPSPPADHVLPVIEMDELYTFEGEKKKGVRDHLCGASESLHHWL